MKEKPHRIPPTAAEARKKDLKMHLSAYNVDRSRAEVDEGLNGHSGLVQLLDAYRHEIQRQLKNLPTPFKNGLKNTK